MEQNVFILSIDSLHYHGVADVIEEIADMTNGVLFTNAVAPANETKSAMPALAAGVYDDSLSGRGLPETGPPTPLLEVARDHGFKTGLWSDNFLFGSEYNYDRGVSAGDGGAPTRKKRLAQAIQQSWLSPAFGLFEQAYFNIAQPMADAVSGYSPFYRSAASLNAEVYRWLTDSEAQTGHVCWIHYMDTHHPYEPPEEYLSAKSLTASRSRSELGELSRKLVKSDHIETISQDDLADVRAAYQASCQYIGDEIAKFADRLQSEGYFDPERDIFVLTADHGECLRPETGVLGHAPAAFYEDILNVPLVIAAPEWATQQIDEQVSLIDLMPTVLQLADLPVPDSVEGRAASTPSNLQRDIAMAVTKSPAEGKWRIFRCARSEKGKKLFGQFDDTLKATSHHECGPYSRETVKESVERSNELSSRWASLISIADDRGGALETTATTGDIQRARQEHLRDLGYLE